MSSVTALPRRAWMIVGLLWMVGCLNYLDRIMLTTMRGSLVEAIPMTDAQFGLLTSVFLWIYGLLSPLGGYLADRFSRSRVVIVSLFVWSAITWMTAHAQTFEQLLLTRALMGISEACYLPAALALISDYHRGSTRSLATGIHMTGVFIGAGLGGLGGYFAEHKGWEFAFEVFGVFGMLYAFVIAFLLRDAPAEPVSVEQPKEITPRFFETLIALFSLPRFLAALSFWGLLGIAGWAVMGWMPTYLAAHFKLGQGAAGLSATGYLQIACLCGVLVGGIWADRWSRTNANGRVYVSLIGLLLAAPGVLLAAHTDTLILAITGIVIYGFCRTFTDANMMPILCLIAERRHRATGYGILNLFSCVIGGLAIYAGGVLRDRNVELDKIFYFASGALVVSAALLFLVRQKGDAVMPDAKG